MFKPGDRLILKQDGCNGTGERVPAGTRAVMTRHVKIAHLDGFEVSFERYGTATCTDSSAAEYFALDLSAPAPLPIPEALRAWFQDVEKYTRGA